MNMAVRKIKKTWWVDFRFDHTRYRKRSPENSRNGALAYEAVMRGKLSRGEDITRPMCAIPREVTFKEFAERWFEDYVLPNNKPSEQKTKRYILASSLIPFFGKTLVSRISASDIERYKASESRKGLANKTINNKLAVLRKCLASAYDWSLLDNLPPKVRALKSPPPETDYLTMEEAEMLLAHASGTVREMVRMALRTGMRQGELRGLQWDAIDWENRIVVIRHSLCDYTHELTSPKSNRERYIPLSDDLYAMLAARRQRSGYVFTDDRNLPFNGHQLMGYLKRALKQADMREIGWHSLRHTFASQLAMNGVPLRVVQELLGHSTIAMTMRYSHVVPGSLHAAIRSLSYPNNGNSGNLWSTVRDAA